jgi:hypothetical protein
MAFKGIILKDLDNRVLRRIFEPTNKQVTGGSRYVDNEELHNLYSSPNIMSLNSRRTRLAGHVESVGNMRIT